ncbi:MAG: S1C family serine protease [Patescibacteria group bacterium]
MKRRDLPAFLHRDHLLVTVLIALMVSGAVSAALYFALVMPSLNRIETKVGELTMGTTTTPTTPQVEVVPVSSKPLVSGLPKELISQPSSAVQVVKRNKELEADGIIQPEQIIGEAVAVTGDGWFVLPSSVANAQNMNTLSLAVRGGLAPIKKAIRDKSTGFVYVKTDVTNMTAANFVRPSLIEEGATLYAETSPTVFAPVALSDLAYAVGIQSSEQQARHLRVVLPTGLSIVGAPLRDSSGRVVGIIDLFDKNTGSWLVVPVGTVASDISSIVSDGAIHRATLGVRGIDLAQTLLTTSTSTRADLVGFLLKSEKKLGPAVKADGPAAGNLVEGDIIERVERDVLDGSADLAEVLMDYRPGATVTFYGKRKNESFQAKISLGNATATEILK